MTYLYQVGPQLRPTALSENLFMFISTPQSTHTNILTLTSLLFSSSPCSSQNYSTLSSLSLSLGLAFEEHRVRELNMSYESENGVLNDAKTKQGLNFLDGDFFVKIDDNTTFSLGVGKKILCHTISCRVLAQVKVGLLGDGQLRVFRHLMLSTTEMNRNFG